MTVPIRNVFFCLLIHKTNANKQYFSTMYRHQMGFFNTSEHSLSNNFDKSKQTVLVTFILQLKATQYNLPYYILGFYYMGLNEIFQKCDFRFSIANNTVIYFGSNLVYIGWFEYNSKSVILLSSFQALSFSHYQISSYYFYMFPIQ